MYVEYDALLFLVLSSCLPSEFLLHHYYDNLDSLCVHTISLLQGVGPAQRGLQESAEGAH